MKFFLMKIVLMKSDSFILILMNPYLTQETEALRCGFREAKFLAPFTPQAAMAWIGEVEDATGIEDLVTSASIKRAIFIAFDVLDSKMCKRNQKNIAGNFRSKLLWKMEQHHCKQGS